MLTSRTKRFITLSLSLGVGLTSVLYLKHWISGSMGISSTQSYYHRFICPTLALIGILQFLCYPLFPILRKSREIMSPVQTQGH